MKVSSTVMAHPAVKNNKRIIPNIGYTALTFVKLCVKTKFIGVSAPMSRLPAVGRRKDCVEVLRQASR